jgi:hypothetical protein
MAGAIISVIPPRQFNFGNLTLNNSLSIVLKQSIDVTDWLGAALMVRVASLSMTGGNAQIQVLYEALTPDDPGVTFVSDTFSSIYLTSATAPQSCQVVPIGGALGPALRVVVRATRTLAATPPDPQDMVAMLSVDLCVRNFLPPPNY